MAMKKVNTEKKESPEKIIGEDLVSNSFRNQKTYQQQMRLADMESQLKNLKGQLTKTKEQLEKTEALLREELSSGKQLQKMKDDYSNWVADPRDVRFDESWRLILVIAFLLPTTLSCLFFWIILT
jgi:small-conductance mechanosensitive channel